jgi:transketolase
MRNTFASEILKLREYDSRIVLLTGDIGNNLFNQYKSRFPNYFFNCGIAEANMTGVAAGLALSGLRPFTYSITPFNTLRCLEQIKLDICDHNLPVVIVGMGSGLAYSNQGCTHQSLDDVAIMRTLPNMTVVCPADNWELRLAMRKVLQQDGPIYLRIGKKGEPNVHQNEVPFHLGKGISLNEGDDICLLCCGTMVAVGQEATDILKKKGWNIQLVSMHTVKPIDRALLSDVFSRCLIVATLEEHCRDGGLGSAVAEWLTDQKSPTSTLVRFGTPDRFLHGIGSQNEARTTLGIDANTVANRLHRQSLAVSDKGFHQAIIG